MNKGLDIQSHGYYHLSFDTIKDNYKDIKKADEFLRMCGADPIGFASPFGVWNPSVGKALEKLGYKYSSHFLTGSDRPFYPKGSSILEIPIFPVCLGNLMKMGLDESQMKTYYLKLIRSSNPLCLYGHPRNFSKHINMLEYILEEVLIKGMEDRGIIKYYKTVLDAKKLGKGTTAFILASFGYRTPGIEKSLDQREIAKKIAKFPEVLETHLISGSWDILIKVKAKDVDEIGKFVVDKLRKVKGVEKTLSCMVYGTAKESLDISL